MKLSDTQLLILSSASQRSDHAAVLPANLKGSAAKKVVDRLLNEKFLQELRATEAKSSEGPSRAKRSGAKKTDADSAKATKASPNRAKSDSKQDKIVALLQHQKARHWMPWSRRRNSRSTRYADFSPARCARS